MIDTSEFVRQAELDLRVRGAISRSTRRAWSSLSPEGKAAFGAAMDFLGCGAEEANGAVDGSVRQTDRIAAARLMLLKLKADTMEPCWSSEMLKRLVTNVAAAPSGSVGDVLYALNGLLRDFPSKLSKPLANLIKDLVIECFVFHRTSYELIDWRPLIETLSASAAEPQLYLALHAVPPHLITTSHAQTIANGLQASPCREEATNALAS